MKILIEEKSTALIITSTSRIKAGTQIMFLLLCEYIIYLYAKKSLYLKVIHEIIIIQYKQENTCIILGNNNNCEYT